LDTHKDSTSVAACEASRDPARFVGTIGPDVRVLLKLLAKAGDPAKVSVLATASMPSALARTRVTLDMLLMCALKPVVRP